MSKANKKAKLILALLKFKKKYDLEDVTVYGNMQDFKQYSEYGHSGLVGMTFEGNLYEAINYGSHPHIFNELDAICEDNDVWYELGNAWNCAFYDN